MISVILNFTIWYNKKKTYLEGLVFNFKNNILFNCSKKNFAGKILLSYKLFCFNLKILE